MRCHAFSQRVGRDGSAARVDREIEIGVILAQRLAHVFDQNLLSLTAPRKRLTAILSQPKASPKSVIKVVNLRVRRTNDVNDAAHPGTSMGVRIAERPNFG